MKSNNPSVFKSLAGHLLVLIGFLVVWQAIGAISMSALNLRVNENGQLSSSNFPHLVKYLFLSSQFIASLLGLVLIPYWYLSKRQPELLKIIMSPSGKQVWLFLLLGIALLLSSIPAVAALGAWNKAWLHSSDGIKQTLESWEGKMEDLYRQLLHFETTGELIFSIVVIAVLTGIAEEFIFRGFLQNAFASKLNIHLAILLSAFIFSSIHLQFTGLLARWYLGILLGYMYWFSGNIWISVAAHCLNNLIALLSYYSFQKGYISTSPEQLESSPLPVPLVMTSIFFAVLLLMRMWRLHNQCMALPDQSNDAS
jgi:hypothetical protein